MTATSRRGWIAVRAGARQMAEVVAGPAYELPRFRGALAVFVMLLGVLAGYLIPRGGRGNLTLLAVMGLAGAAAFLIGLRRPTLAPLAVLCTAAFVPLSLPTGTESRLVASLVLTIVAVAAWLLRSATITKQILLTPSPVNKPLMAFVVVTMISLPWSIAMRDPLVSAPRSFPIVQGASMIVMLMLPGAFWLVAGQVHDVKILKIMTGIMLVAGCLGAIKQYDLLRLPVNTNGLFNMWVITLAAGVGLFNRSLPRWKRALLLGLAAVWVYWGFVLHISWLAGWLSGMIALFVLAAMRSRKIALVAAVLMVALVLANRDYYLGSVVNNEENESGFTRLAALQANWRVTGYHLLLGTGPAGYAAYYMSYFPNQAMATHNNFIDVLAQTGIIGLVICVWFFASLGRLGIRVWRRLKGRGDFAEALAAAALAGTIATFVMMAFGDWVFPFAYTQTIAGFDHAVYSWLFMGAIPALDRLISSPPKDPANG